MYQKLLELVEFKLKEVISREHSLLIFMIGVPNIAKSVLINSIHQIASPCFPGEDEVCYCRPTAWFSLRYCWIQDIVDVVAFMRSRLIARNLFLTCVILFDHRKSDDGASA
ncbi:uncharacterized protein LOC115952506 [Quercus lobata]|uniref:uncharacterized protein LOC115952506 n=1 Tax=Quercus lobata TaxID=97700 RepID=UPI0012454B1B|nr:uncharacterized protein LOC115952506 [Quercus lobata]